MAFPQNRVISLHTLRDKLFFYCITSKPSITQTEQLQQSLEKLKHRTCQTNMLNYHSVVFPSVYICDDLLLLVYLKEIKKKTYHVFLTLIKRSHKSLFNTSDVGDLPVDAGTLCARNMVVFDWSTKIVYYHYLFYIPDIFFFISIHYLYKSIGLKHSVQISCYEFTVISSVIN